MGDSMKIQDDGLQNLEKFGDLRHKCCGIHSNERLHLPKLWMYLLQRKQQHPSLLSTADSQAFKRPSQFARAKSVHQTNRHGNNFPVFRHNDGVYPAWNPFWIPLTFVEFTHDPTAAANRAVHIPAGCWSWSHGKLAAFSDPNIRWFIIHIIPLMIKLHWYTIQIQLGTWNATFFFLKTQVIPFFHRPQDVVKPGLGAARCTLSSCVIKRGKLGNPCMKWRFL